MKNKELVETICREIAAKAHKVFVCDPKEEKLHSFSEPVKNSYPFTTMEESVLSYNPFTEKYSEVSPAILGKAGKGRQYSLKEIYEKMREAGLETYVVYDEEKIRGFGKICDSLQGEVVDILPRTYIKFHDPAKNSTVQRCWKCPNSEVIVYPPGMIDVLCRLKRGAQHPMVARIYPNGSLKTTALFHGKSIPEAIKFIHTFIDTDNYLGRRDIKPFPEECHQRLLKSAGLEHTDE